MAEVDDELDRSGNAARRIILQGAGFRADRRSGMWFNNRTGQTVGFDRVCAWNQVQLTSWLIRRAS